MFFFYGQLLRQQIVIPCWTPLHSRLCHLSSADFFVTEKSLFCKNTHTCLLQLQVLVDSKKIHCQVWVSKWWILHNQHNSTIIFFAHVLFRHQHNVFFLFLMILFIGSIPVYNFCFEFHCNINILSLVYTNIHVHHLNDIFQNTCTTNELYYNG